MKSTLILFTAAIVFSTVSCKDEKKETTSYIADTTATVSTNVSAAVPAMRGYDGRYARVLVDSVPVPVATSFKQKYPKILTPEWIYYTPVESDQLPMDDTYYYVQFSDNGDDYTSWWNDDGEWVKTSTIIPVGDPRLPQAVNKTITAMFADYTIEEISKENDKNMDMYEIKLRKGDDKVKVKILPNGEIFKLKA